MASTQDDSSTSSSGRRYLPLGLACVPALLALICSQFEAHSASVQGQATRSPLAFHQYAVNLGRVEPRRDHFAIFAFTNTSSETMELRQLKTSCGCVTQHRERKVFAPQEEGEFALRIQSANQEPGHKRYTCKAIYGPVGKPDVSFETDLAFEVWLPEQSVMVRPRVLMVHQPNDIPTTPKNPIAITDLRPRPMKVLNVSCEHPAVTVKRRDASLFTEKDREAGIIEYIEVTVNKVDPGQHETEVRIHTDDAEFNVLRIPLRIYGPNIGVGLPNEPKRTTRPKFEPANASDS